MKREKPLKGITQGPEHFTVEVTGQVFHVFIGDGASQASGIPFDEFSVQDMTNKGDWFKVKRVFTGADLARGGVSR